MKYFQIPHGLDLPIAGVPKQEIENGPSIETVYLIGPDYIGMKPSFVVNPGDKVSLGQAIFEDKKNPGVKFTAPAAGTIKEIVRGEKRAFRYLTIQLDKGKEESAVSFEKYDSGKLLELAPEAVEHNLVESGLWTALRTRPFSRIPALGSRPHSLFVTAMDTNPLAPSARLIIEQNADDFADGIKVLTRISGNCLYLCKGPGWDAPGGGIPGVEVAVFEGRHPAGLAGTHIHFLDPVSAKKTVWSIGYQDVIAIGKLFTSGKLSPERIISLGGPKVKNPRLIRTRFGASLQELTARELENGSPNRVVSGSVLCGRTAISGLEPEDQWYPGLGRYHNLVSVLGEVYKRHFFGWMAPGFKWFSVSKTVASYLLPPFRFKMTTNLFGGRRAIFPYAKFDEMMPLDILPTQLFRALSIGSRGIELAESLGFLELDEEDLGLCTYIDPGKNDFGAMLREMLDLYAKEM